MWPSIPSRVPGGCRLEEALQKISQAFNIDNLSRDLTIRHVTGGGVHKVIAHPKTPVYAAPISL